MMEVKGTFQIVVDGELRTYHRYKDIPQKIDRVIRFEPQIPEGPHTDEEHKWIESLPQNMEELMKRERRNDR